MATAMAEPVSTEAERAELQAVLQSQLFSRAPTLAHLLSYLCEKRFAGESAQIKEYSIALDVFGRQESFDQDSDSIVRVQANRLRKRLAEYYAGEGAGHHLHIAIPVGQYVPQFDAHAVEAPTAVIPPKPMPFWKARPLATWGTAAVVLVLIAVGLAWWIARNKKEAALAPATAPSTQAAPPVGLPVGDEVRILAGSTRSYVDRSGKSWSPDSFFAGGMPVHSSVQHIWRTQDPSIYRSSRQGDFTYDIPLKRGTYELHLHFAETYYGPEDSGGGGEGSRVMNIQLNGQPLLSDFDVIADSGGGRTADVKVFTDVSPASDGYVHLAFTSVGGGRAMVAGIEILPGTASAIRPVRIVAREVPYYSNDSHWWSADTYFKGGQLASSEEPAKGTDDPEFYETERWGHFSYAIPVTPGKYTLILYFIERSQQFAERGEPAEGVPGGEENGARVFNVFCNGKAILKNVNIVDEVGENRALIHRVTGLEPNSQGKLMLEFVPVTHYATITAIEVLPQ